MEIPWESSVVGFWPVVHNSSLPQTRHLPQSELPGREQSTRSARPRLLIADRIRYGKRTFGFHTTTTLIGPIKDSKPDLRQYAQRTVALRYREQEEGRFASQPVPHIRINAGQPRTGRPLASPGNYGAKVR